MSIDECEYMSRIVPWINENSSNNIMKFDLTLLMISETHTQFGDVKDKYIGSLWNWVNDGDFSPFHKNSLYAHANY